MSETDKYTENSQYILRKNDVDLLIKVSAPGKIILHGEHSVVYGKLAVAASLGLRTKLTLSELKCCDNQPNTVTVQLKNLNLVQSYDIKLIQRELLDKSRYVTRNELECGLEKPELINHEGMLSIAESFVRNHTKSPLLNSYEDIALSSLFYLFFGILGSVDIELKPLIINLETDLTISAGTGSSASYLVTLAAAFIHYARIKGKNYLKNGQKMQLSNSLKLEDKDLQLISKWAQNAERIIHGPASGVDNTICTFGSMVEFRKGSPPKIINIPTKFRVLLVNSMVPRDTKHLVGIVAANKKEFPGIVDPVLDAMDALTQSALNTIIRLSQLNKYEKTNQEHLLNDEIDSLYKKLGRLTDMNQNLLATLGASHPKLDTICSILKSSGLHGKLTGAGGGGYAITLIPPYFSDNEIGTLMKRLETEGFGAQLTDLGGPGVLIDEFKIN